MNTDLLTVTAQKGLTKSLTDFGNALSTPHKMALYSMLDAFSRMAAGQLQGRYAWGLAPGLGKSRAVIEWATAVHNLKLPYSLTVCASRIEQLCTMKQDMMDNGIPESSIGLIYYGAQITKDRRLPFPSTTDNDTRPFLLATHARVKSPKDHMQQDHVFKGQARSLVVWDESLLVADTELFDAKKLVRQMGGWLSELKLTEGDHKNLHNWLTNWRDLLTVTFQGWQPGLNMLPKPCLTLSPDEQDIYGAWFKTDKEDLLNDFIRVCDQPMRMLKHGREAVVSYSVVVPSELRNIMVLDASYAIRKLEKADKTIQNAETLKAWSQHGLSFDKLKRYDHLTVYRMAHSGARCKVVNDKAQMRKITKDVVKLIQELPPTEGVLVFVYKERDKKDAKTQLERELIKQGVSLTATVIDSTGKRQPRLNILTWGQETSLNCYSFCPNVVLVGILHRNRAELETAHLGQLNDIQYKASTEELDALCLSERTHLAYQAISRGSSRTTLQDSQAAPSRCFIIEREEGLETELTKVMPGCQFKKWTPVYADAQAYGALVTDLTNRIDTKLKGLKEEMSVRRFKGLVLGPTKVASKTWQRAFNRGLEQNHQWKQQDQSLRRAA